MQGLVTIDFGNSNPHAGIFQKNQNEWKLIKVSPWSELNIFLSQLQITPDNSSMVLAEVKPREEELAIHQRAGFLITRVKEYWRGNMFAGMPVKYAKTLGEDRLITAWYCFKKLKQNILIIDAGTFLTMDVVTTHTGFEGGYIIPGIQNYISTFTQGEQLKSVDIDKDISHILPQGTSEAMRDGYFAFAALAQRMILEHKIERVLLTGGQCSIWKQIFDKLEVGVVVQEEPSLIHLALHYWMTTQIEPL